MGKAYNKTIIIGRLGINPELDKSGKVEIAKFPICNSIVKDGKEEIQWHNIRAIGKQAILCHEHLSKGDLCCIEGRSTNVEKNGQSKQIIIAERITFLSPKKIRIEGENNETE